MAVTIETPRFLTVPEARQYIHKLRSVSWLSQAIVRGEIPASRIGRSYLISVADLDKYIERCRTTRPHKKVRKPWIRERWDKYRAAQAAKASR